MLWTLNKSRSSNCIEKAELSVIQSLRTKKKMLAVKYCHFVWKFTIGNCSSLGIQFFLHRTSVFRLLMWKTFQLNSILLCFSMFLSDFWILPLLFQGEKLQFLNDCSLISFKV